MKLIYQGKLFAISFRHESHIAKVKTRRTTEINGAYTPDSTGEKPLRDKEGQIVLDEKNRFQYPVYESGLAELGSSLGLTLHQTQRLAHNGIVAETIYVEIPMRHTVCTIKMGEASADVKSLEAVAAGVAQLSITDHPNKEEGRVKALGNALEASDFNQTTKRYLHLAYLHRRKGTLTITRTTPATV